MDNNLHNALKKMKEVDFRELRMNMNVASKLRKMMFDFVLDKEDVAERLGVQVPEVEQIMNAAYSLDLRMVSKIDTYEEELIIAEEEKEYEEEEVEEEESIFEDEPEEEDNSLDERAEAEEIAYKSEEEDVPQMNEQEQEPTAHSGEGTVETETKN